jgi:hypothetical protein
MLERVVDLCLHLAVIQVCLSYSKYGRSRLDARCPVSAFVSLIVLEVDALILTGQGPADKRTLFASYSYRDLKRAGLRWPYPTDTEMERRFDTWSLAGRPEKSSAPIFPRTSPKGTWVCS